MQKKKVSKLINAASIQTKIRFRWKIEANIEWEQLILKLPGAENKGSVVESIVGLERFVKW